MSPAPARTSLDDIVAAARDILEADGLDGVTMATIATRVGVRPPSLYKHVRDREALLSLVAERTAMELEAALRESDPIDGSGEERVRALANAYRAFARRSPRAASLLFGVAEPSAAPSPAVSAAAARPLLAVSGALAGARNALSAARLLTAFVFGFTTMEQAGAFRLGGDVDAAFDFSLDVLIRGLALT
jgi:AcrR family transcriptional regulator